MKETIKESPELNEDVIHLKRTKNDLETAVNKVRNLTTKYWIYRSLLILRILITLLPQPGYIHPDEYFQSLEVFVGDIFDVESSIPWEFNCTFPIRSVTVPYLVVGLPLRLLKQINVFYQTYFKTNLLTPFSILVFSRFVICLLSFTVDFSLYRICNIYRQKSINRMIILASSYVMLVYGTRTLSNTTEMCLFSLLLYLVAECIHEQEKEIQFRTSVSRYFGQLERAVDRVNYIKIMKSYPKNTLRYCFIISSLTVLGCFNRPTFAAFALGPVFFWLHRGLSSEIIGFKEVHIRIFFFLLSSLPTILLLILIDSSYYGYISFYEVYNYDVSLNSFVVTPLNFLRYNLDPKNLAKHGLHPHYLHVLINIPLLFSILAWTAYTSLGVIIWRVFHNKYEGRVRAFSVANLMKVSFITPVAMLSLFPHQEPRFLIPIILPLVFLYSDSLWGIILTAKQSIWPPKLYKVALVIWFSVNALLTLFYGFVHQAGVYPLTSHLAYELGYRPQNTTVHLLTNYIYNLPQSLLQEPSSNKIFKSVDGVKYKKPKRFFLYELGSDPVEKLVDKISTLYSVNQKFNQRYNMDYKIYVALPTVLKHSFEETLCKQKPKLDFREIVIVYPHLSVEVFSNSGVFKLCTEGGKYSCVYDLWNVPLMIMRKLYDVFGLTLYQIDSSFYNDYSQRLRRWKDSKVLKFK